MPTNTECVVSVLAAHREARQWSDDAVAADLVAQLGLDPDADAKNAKPVVPPGITEDEVLAHEAAAKEATDKAKASREALNAQRADAEKDEKPADRPQASNRPAGAPPAAQQPHPPGMLTSQQMANPVTQQGQGAQAAQAAQARPSASTEQHP